MKAVSYEKTIEKRKLVEINEKEKTIDHKEMVNVKKSVVYSRIAIMGRNPRKNKERKKLIDALNKSCVEVNVGNKIIKKIPFYVTMSVKDAENCLGVGYKRYLTIR